MSGPGGRLSVHATCVLAGRRAVLIRGPAGSGKSSLAFALLAAAGPGRCVRLVADDRCLLAAAGGRLVACAPPEIAGLIELRGVGLLAVACEPRAVVALAVDLEGGAPERLPERAQARTQMCGVVLPRLVLPAGAADAGRVLAAMREIEAGRELPAEGEGAGGRPRFRA